ncbi:MAG: DUF3488 and transglutaminase-like domain-containing protein [Burkholderiaceae bacterium]|nr:DUF3488 and transglutaminase-like domain-containing protein [Burkholderiaceae bacterium]
MRLRDTLAALPRDTRDTLFLLGVIAGVIAPHASHLPLWATALAAGLLLWRGALAWTQRRLPGRWTLLLLLALAVGGTLLTHRTVLGRDAGVTLIVVLLALKTLELRARRDALVVFFLGFFALLSHFFFSQSLGTAVAMLVALLGLLTALVNAHMPVGRPPLSVALRTAARLALLGAPIMAALFLLFPRMAPLWGMPGDPIAGRSGLSGAMRVGQIAELAMDESVALRVRFDTPGGTPPQQSALYFRGPVLSQFDGREWRPAPDGPAPQGGPSTLQVHGEPVRYTLTLEAHQRRWLLLLDAARDPPTFAGGEGVQATMAPDLQWRSDRPVREVLRYQALSYPDFRHGAGPWTERLRDFTELPTGFNPRTLELAQQLRNDPRIAPNPAQDNAAALVAAVLERLRTGGYRYTLEPGLSGVHTADAFWFDSRQGFCEHIASAFVVLIRALDIPARIVTGYQGGERNPIDGQWTVRQSDAHAWAEVWLAGQGWVRVDPTSAVAPARTGALQRLQAPRSALAEAMGNVMSPGLVHTLRAAWEAANNRWNQWVLNYTQARQLNLLQALGFEAPRWEDLVTLLAGLMALAIAGNLGWTLWQRQPRAPELRLLQQVRRRLARQGLPLGEQSAPRGTALAVLDAYGESARPLHDWLLQLERLRYGPAGPDPAAALAALRRQLRQLPWPGPG